MATSVPNPFDTQQPRAQNTGIIANAQAQRMTMSPTVEQPATMQRTAMQPTSMQLPVQPAYTPDRPAVNNATDTTQGQLTSILAGDSPLMQRARTIASQQSNSRGLLNSSMNSEAGTAAMIDRAVPIAGADAATYDTRSRFNADATNTSLSTGANIAAQMNLQRGAQEFQAGESSLERGHQTQLQAGQQQFQAGESVLDRSERLELQQLQQQFQSGESSLDRAQQDRLQELQQKFQGEQSGLDREQQTNLQAGQQQFQSGESALDRAERSELQQLQQMFQSGESALDRGQQERLQYLQQKFQGDQAGLDRTQQTDLQNSQQGFQAGESALDRAEREELQQLQQQFQSGESSLDRAQQDRLQELQQKFQSTEAGLDRTQQTDVAKLQIEANRQQAEIQQRFQETQAKLDRDQQTSMANLQASLQEAMNNRTIPQQFANNVAAQSQNTIDVILANGDLTPEAKRAAIGNVIAAANAQIQWASTFYGTPITELKEPGHTAPGPAYPWIGPIGPINVNG